MSVLIILCKIVVLPAIVAMLDERSAAMAFGDPLATSRFHVMILGCS